MIPSRKQYYIWLSLVFLPLFFQIRGLFFFPHQMEKDKKNDNMLFSWSALTLTGTNKTQHSRYFGIDPISKEESNALTQRDQSNIRAAICHPTLHGNPSVLRILTFISYHRLLGFDHIFFWYEGNAVDPLHFQHLPYVSFKKVSTKTANSYYHGQFEVMTECMTKEAVGYDWAMTLDADEYLWFNEQISLKDFLLKHSNYTYLSFGKFIYTTMHYYNTTQNKTGFQLEQYPFTAGSYCFPRYGHSYCPGWHGRSKVMLRPSVHTLKTIHGEKIHEENTGIHFDTSKAHLKEWCNILDPIVPAHIIRNSTTSFFITNRTQVNTHATMKSHHQKKGKVEFFFDHTLNDWLKFVSTLGNL